MPVNGETKSFVVTSVSQRCQTNQPSNYHSTYMYM